MCVQGRLDVCYTRSRADSRLSRSGERHRRGGPLRRRRGERGQRPAVGSTIRLRRPAGKPAGRETGQFPAAAVSSAGIRTASQVSKERRRASLASPGAGAFNGRRLRRLPLKDASRCRVPATGVAGAGGRWEETASPPGDSVGVGWGWGGKGGGRRPPRRKRRIFNTDNNNDGCRILTIIR